MNTPSWLKHQQHHFVRNACVRTDKASLWACVPNASETGQGHPLTTDAAQNLMLNLSPSPYRISRGRAWVDWLSKNEVQGAAEAWYLRAPHAYAACMSSTEQTAKLVWTDWYSALWQGRCSRENQTMVCLPQTHLAADRTSASRRISCSWGSLSTVKLIKKMEIGLSLFRSQISIDDIFFFYSVPSKRAKSYWDWRLKFQIQYAK